MNRKLLSFVLMYFIVFASCVSNKKEIPDPANESGYPDEVANILVNKCATGGCHNTQSKEGAAGLDLSTWNKLFEGARSGANVIPYSSDQSNLLYFINTDSSIGVTQLPVMPYNGTPLSLSEYLMIKNWIDIGAPDRNGNVKFADNPLRKKLYVPNQGCDLVAVVDAESKLVTRYIHVGSAPQIESPHMIKVTPDNKYWCVSFIAGSKFQKYNVTNDSLVSEVEIGFGSWNTFAYNPDGNTAYIIDFSGSGRLAIVNLQTMTLVGGLLITDPTFSSPHGSAVSPDGNRLYVTQQLGHGLYKFDISTFPPDLSPINFTGSTISQPHEIAFSPDGTKYFVTCQQTDEVRAFNSSNDQFITSIPTADYPQEMSFSSASNYLFVSCMGAENKVSIIDYVNLIKIKDVFTGYTPHGITVDDAHGLVFVTNRNLTTSGGPAPHHTSVCGGRNGYMTAIDLNTLELLPDYKHELSVDPYGLGSTH